MKRFIGKFTDSAFSMAMLLLLLILAATVATVSAAPNDPGTNNNEEVQIIGGGGATFQVANDFELADALMHARKGDTIQIARGVYSTFVDASKMANGVKIKGSGARSLILGKIETGKRDIITDLGLYYAAREDHPFALWTKDSATIKRVVIYLPNSGTVGIMAGSSDLGSTRKFRYVVEDTQLLGSWVSGSRNVGLSIDVAIDRETSVIQGNTFVGLECGIDLSIDVVFGDIPTNEGRMEAYMVYAQKLKDANTFLGVENPVCGGRG